MNSRSPFQESKSREFEFVLLSWSSVLDQICVLNEYSSFTLLGWFVGKRNCSIETVLFHMCENSRIGPLGKYNGSYIKVCVVFCLSRHFIKETGKSASPLGILWIQNTFHLLEPSMQTTWIVRLVGIFHSFFLFSYLLWTWTLKFRHVYFAA